MRVRKLSSLLFVIALGASACAKEEATPANTTDQPSPTTTSEPAAQPAYQPLTGEQLPLGQSAAKDHPVIVVKMDNTESASPQAGLSEADLVVEELVEGGLTRLAVFYYTNTPAKVGPVRSMRASDIAIVSPVDARVVTSGAASVTINRIRNAGITFYPEGVAGITRDSTRPAPYNVMADLRRIAKIAKGPSQEPAPYFSWLSDAAALPSALPAALPAGQPAKTFEASFGWHGTEWESTPQGYRNVNSNAAADDQFIADTVLVLKVPMGDAGYTDPAGNPVPETLLTGQGKAFMFYGGRVIALTWHKDGPADPLRFTSRLGDQAIPVGNTWIELVPAATGGVTWQR